MSGVVKAPARDAMQCWAEELEPIGYVPPAEYEEAYHQQQSKPPAELALT